MEQATEKKVSINDQNSEPETPLKDDLVTGHSGVTNFSISAKHVLLWLMIFTLALNFIGALGRGIEYLLGIEETTPVVHLFHVAEEGNITSWFSAMLLFVSSVLLAIVASTLRKQAKPYVRHWSFLSIVFFYMTIDEAARIHELTIIPLRSLLKTSGVLYYAWLVLAIPLLVVLVIFYAKFLRELPRDTFVLFILAGGIFVFGAAGMEMAAGFATSRHLSPLWQPFLVTIEELSENVGIVIFIYALLSHIKSHLQVSSYQFRVT